MDAKGAKNPISLGVLGDLGVLYVPPWWKAVELVGEGGRGGQRAALSTASSPVRRKAHRPQIHSLAACGAAARLRFGTASRRSRRQAMSAVAASLAG